jgi:hypothetical protein
MKNRSGGLQLSDADERWMSAHRSVEWFWIGDGQNCDAYVAIGRGIDLNGIVHEWGGNPQALRALLAWLKATRPGLILLGAPWILAQFGIDVKQAKPEYLCLARVFDPERIVKAFYPASDFKAIAEEAGFKISGKQGSGLLSVPDAARLVFGPHVEDDGAKRLSVPIPLWIWGLDAV